MDAMSSDVTDGGKKSSYTIPCATVFKDMVEALARRRGVNVGDIARSVLLVLPLSVITDFPDPGDPPPEDRELVVLKSGPSEGRPWRRKPRLQVRMVPGYEITIIRRALGLALAMEQGDLMVDVQDPTAPPPPPSPPPQAAPADDSPAPKTKERRSPGRRKSDFSEAEALKALATAREEIDRLKAIVSVLAFEPLDDGVNNRAEALYVLGFAPRSRPDDRSIKSRFRIMATIHHPDSNFGDHIRMSQLNQAMEFLRDAL